MNTRKQRRLGVEALEARLVLDSIGVAAGPPNVDWQSVIVLFHDNVPNPHAAAQALSVAHGGALGHVYEHALKGFSAQLPAQAVAALAKNPQVKLVEQDLAMEAFADETQVIPTGVDRIDAEAAARPVVDVSGINIAIIDTGIQYHQDLNVVGGYNATSSDPLAWNDGYGHGTHVAGIAAALDNGFGVVGVAPGARLWAVKVLNDRGMGKTSDIIEGIDWVTSTRTDGIIDGNEIDVANMSLGGTGVSTAYHTAIQNSVATGIVYVVAAGNSYRDIIGSDFAFGTSDDTIPAVYPEVATISAMADSDGEPGGRGPTTSRGYADDTFADFSNFSNSDGWNNSWYFENNVVSSPGLGIDLMMPGVDILSTYKNNGYATMSGTSMAAPHAAGLAALYIAQHGPAANASEVYVIRQALIDGGMPWRSDNGLVFPSDEEAPNPDSPDKHEENLGWAGSAVIDLAPTVTIDAPVDGAALTEVSGVPITATAIAAEGTTIRGVSFAIADADGRLENLTGTPDGMGEWSVDWETRTSDGNLLYADGPYTITAVATATDTNGGVFRASDSITVVLDNVDDPPTVLITSPQSGATVSGSVTITADASDDRDVTNVKFFANDELIATGINESDGWAATWDTNGHPDGQWTITARATDSGGGTGSDSITVIVNNAVTTMTATLEGTAQKVNRNFWQALATVFVKDSADANLSGATVTGYWTPGSSVTGVTKDGMVTLASANLSTRTVSSVKFTLIDVVCEGYEYIPTPPASITIEQYGSMSASPSLYTQLAAWQAIESLAAKPKDRILAPETVDFLMTLDG